MCSGCINTFVTVYLEDGVRKGLYRGLSINYLRVIPQVAVMFSVYELTKQFLSSDMTTERSEWSNTKQEDFCLIFWTCVLNTG